MTTATLSSIARLMRPTHWLKNLLLLFPPFFAGTIGSSDVELTVLPALAAFSMAASCTYVINDIVDRQADRNHVTKKYRAIARGDVKVWNAAILAGALLGAAMLLASAVSERFLGFLIIYLLISVFYSFFFKHIVLIDMFALSSGYILRVVAGGEAFHVAVSSWLFLTVFVVALFLASGKRLGELVSLGENASKHRKSLSLYNRLFLEGVQWLCASVAIVTYALYTIENKSGLFYSVPIALYGLLRYIYIVRQGTGDPTEVLLGDWPLMSTGILWIMVIAVNIYR